MQSNTNSNISQATWIAVGSLASFGFTIISTAILSRYFSKEDYGTYRQVLYVYNTLLIVFTLGLPRAFSFFLPRVSLEHGKSMVNKITNILYLTGIVFSLILFFAAPLIAFALKNTLLESAIKIFSPVPLLMLPTLGIDSIYATYRKAHIAAIYAVLTRLFMLCCVAIPVMLYGGTYITALTGFVISSFLIYLLSIYLKNRPFTGVVGDRCEYSYKEILSYTIPLMLAGIFGVITFSADQFFISRYFGVLVFAEFANGSIEIPFIGMIIGATSAVLFPVFSELFHKKDKPKVEIQQLMRSAFDKTVKLSYPMVVFCWFFADIIMNILYSVSYQDSVIYFRIRIITNLFSLVAYTPLFLAMGKSKLYAKVLIIESIATILILYLGVLFFNSPYIVALLSTICQIVKLLFFVYLVSKYLEISMYSFLPLKFVYKILIPSIIILFVVRNVVKIDNGFCDLLIGGVMYLSMYFIWAKIIKLDYVQLIRPLLSGSITDKFNK